MNKKDIAHFRRQFKSDNDLLKISDIFNVYIMKESSDIYHYESRPFEMLDSDQQELFLTNFKKLLTGQLNEKLFELKFQRDAANSSQLILHKGLLASGVEEWTEQMLQIVAKMLKDDPFSQDTVVTFIRGEYYRPTKRNSDESEENERDEVYTHAFMMCSMNKTEQPQKTLMFDYIAKEFKYNVVVDPVIKLTSPEAGFLFPCFTDHAADVNHVLYAAPKVNEPDPHFIQEVLNGEQTVTAKEDKVIFEEIVREVTGDQLDTSTLARVYEEIQQVIEDNEVDEAPTLDYKDVERVLTTSGVEAVNSDQVAAAFQQAADDPNYELKAASVVPKYTSKSIKIKTKVADIAVSPQDLQYVRQVNYKGKRCLLIEIDEEAVIEGFTMNLEEL